MRLAYVMVIAGLLGGCDRERKCAEARKAAKSAWEAVAIAEGATPPYDVNGFRDAQKKAHDRWTRLSEIKLRIVCGGLSFIAEHKPLKASELVNVLQVGNQARETVAAAHELAQLASDSEAATLATLTAALEAAIPDVEAQLAAQKPHHPGTAALTAAGVKAAAPCGQLQALAVSMAEAANKAEESLIAEGNRKVDAALAEQREREPRVRAAMDAASMVADGPGRLMVTPELFRDPRYADVQHKTAAARDQCSD